MVEHVAGLQSKLHTAGQTVSVRHDALEVLGALDSRRDEHMKLIDHAGAEKRAVGRRASLNNEMSDSKVPC